MSRRGPSYISRWVRVGLSTLVIGASLSGVGRAKEPVTAAPVALERTLPARTVFLWQDEGFQAHEAAYAKTAASDALSATGAYDTFGKLFSAAVTALSLGDDSSELGFIAAHFQHVSAHGFTIAVSLPDGKAPAWPRLMVVLHDGAPLSKQWVEALEAARQKEIKAAEEAAKLAVKQDDAGKRPPATDPSQPATDKPAPNEWISKQIGTRTIWSAELAGAQSPLEPMNYAFWNEGQHLVMVAGYGALDDALAVASGNAPNITTHRLWKGLHGENRPFARRGLGWVDVVMIREVVDDLPLELDSLVENFPWPLIGLVPFVNSEAPPPAYYPSTDNGPVVSLPYTGGEQVAALPPSDESPELPPPLLPDSVQPLLDDPVLPLPAGNEGQLPPEVPPRAKPLPAVANSGKPGLPLIPPAGEAPQAHKLIPPAIDENAKPGLPSEKAVAAAEDDAPPVEIAAEPFKIKQIITAAGLDSIQDWTWQSGYRGRAQWSESSLRTAGPRKGLLGFGTTKTMTINDLPPLPVNTGAFQAMTTDLRNMGAAVQYLVKNAAPLLVTVTEGNLDETLNELPKHLDLLTINEVVSSLDPVVCTYNDGPNGPLTFGPVLAWKVKDAPRLRAAINRLIEAAQPKSAAKPDGVVRANSAPAVKSARRVASDSAYYLEEDVQYFPATADSSDQSELTRKPSSNAVSKSAVNKSKVVAKPVPAYYLGGDEVQYFPDASEAQLARKVEALKAYKQQQRTAAETQPVPAKGEVQLVNAEDAASQPEVQPDAAQPSADTAPGEAPEAELEKAPAAVETKADDDTDEVGFQVTRRTKYGRELISMTMVLGVTFTIDDQWLVMSINPQLVEAFLLRLDGKLPRWQASQEYRDAFQDLPAKFTSIKVDDPRQTLPYLLSMIPPGLGILEQVLHGSSAANADPAQVLPEISAADFPPAELIVQPLFPNITVEVTDDHGTRSYSRTSLTSVSVWNVWPVLLLGGTEFLEDLSGIYLP